MLFNSLEFFIFLIIVFFLYWSLADKGSKFQNVLLLIASYVFYGFWDWRFLLLLIMLSLSNYFIVIAIGEYSNERLRRRLLIVGLSVNIGVLVIFKYFNFFADSLIEFVSLFSINLNLRTINIILPLGISFYVFLSMSYIIDAYRKSLLPYKNIIEVLLTLSFFPIIFAGPIQRPSSLLPQIAAKRDFNYKMAVDGLRQILWGLFAKVVVADNIAPEVDRLFLNYPVHTGIALILGAVLYSIQIYADFSGYSNIAIGTAKLLGFKLMLNFAYPYFSRNISEFWKRWHISLTTWFRDYVFLPISFNLSSKINKERIVLIGKDKFIYLCGSLITWFLTGLWHGANYTFMVWGMINGTLLIIYNLQAKGRKRIFKYLGISNNSPAIIFLESTLTLVIIISAWIFFRAESLGHAISYFNRIFTADLFPFTIDLPLKATVLSFVFIAVELIQRKNEHALMIDRVKYKVSRWGIYLGLILAILFVGGGNQEFIYFQF